MIDDDDDYKFVAKNGFLLQVFKFISQRLVKQRKDTQSFKKFEHKKTRLVRADFLVISSR